MIGLHSKVVGIAIFFFIIVYLLVGAISLGTNIAGACNSVAISVEYGIRKKTALLFVLSTSQLVAIIVFFLRYLTASEETPPG
jgi:hypothetical protein